MTLPRALPVVVVGLSAATAVASLALGVTLWAVVAVAAAAWLAVLVRRYGADLAVPLAVIGLLAFFTLVLLVSRQIHSAVAPAIVIAFAAAGIAAGLWLRRTRGAGARRPVRWDWLATAPAALVWLVAQAATVRLPLNERISWAMRNDISNTLTFAHDVVARGGITPGAGQNPAPIPAALVAAAIASGRGSVPTPGLFLHDILAISVLWGGLIMLTCVLAGATVAAVARALSAPPWASIAGALLGSFLVLSWLFTGYPMEYGFINTHVVLPVLLSTVLLFLSGARRPVVTTAGLLLAVAVTIATWSPVALVPAALLVVHVLVHRRELLAARGVPLVALGGSLVLAVAAGAGIALPSLLTQREALSGAGGIYNPGKCVMFAVAAAVVAAVIVAQRRLRSRVVVGFAALVVAALGGLGVLLFVSRRVADPWTYYPVKFSWMVSLLLIVVLVGALLALAARVRPRAWRAAGFTVIAAAVVWVIAWAPFIVSTHVSMNPIDRLLRSQLVEHYPYTAQAVLDLADQDHPQLLWKSSLYESYGDKVEGEANIWLVQNWVDSLDAQPDLRLFAYITYVDKSVESLCRIGELTPQGLEVHTADPSLAADLDENCPTAPITVVVG